MPRVNALVLSIWFKRRSVWLVCDRKNLFTRG